MDAENVRGKNHRVDIMAFDDVNCQIIKKMYSMKIVVQVMARK